MTEAAAKAREAQGLEAAVAMAPVTAAVAMAEAAMAAERAEGRAAAARVGVTVVEVRAP